MIKKRRKHLIVEVIKEKDKYRNKSENNIQIIKFKLYKIKISAFPLITSK
jgi:hypothetical protein